MENINITDLQSKRKGKMETFESKCTQRPSVQRRYRSYSCFQRTCLLGRQTERLYIKYYTVTQNSFIFIYITLEGELHTTRSFEINALPWKCLWNVTSGRVMCSTESILNRIPKFFCSLFLEKVFHCDFFSLFCQNFQCVCIKSWDKMETNSVLKISRSHLGQCILRYANTLEKLMVFIAVSESGVKTQH